MKKSRIDTSDLVRKMPGIIAQAQQTADDYRDKLTVDIYANAIRETPVDTGAARHGWSMDLIGGQQHIQNSITYIVRLLYGWSKQAPSGWLDAIIDRHTRL